METGKAPLGGEGRDHDDACTSQEMPKMASKPLEVERPAADSPSQPSKDTNPANTENSDV